jgi:hypothetical protein
MEVLKNFILKCFGLSLRKNEPGEYGLCEECHQSNSGPGWCTSCNAKHFQEGFKDWTSGNQDIDDVIRDSQLSATLESNVLEWIPYNRFIGITKIGNGGYGTVHKAQWLDGRIVGWDTEHNKWKRVTVSNKEENAYLVALKTLHNSQNLSAELLNEVCFYDFPSHLHYYNI